MILGLTGSNCSGKDTIADYIVAKYNFIHYSLSDFLRIKMKEQNIPITRENLISFGKSLREKDGNGALAKLALEKIASHMKSDPTSKNFCITSIRHPDEVRQLRKEKSFILMYVDAPDDVRFERLLKRNRAGDPLTFERFKELEAMESQDSGSGQQLSNTAKLADIKFINDFNDISELESSVYKILKKEGL
jgi:dephospho-CoA kinase